MAILIMCENPDCGEFFEVPDTAAGGEVCCPTCNFTQIAPLGNNGKKSKKIDPAPALESDTIPLARQEADSKPSRQPISPGNPTGKPLPKNNAEIELDEDPQEVGDKLWIPEDQPDSETPQDDNEDLPCLPADESDEIETFFAEEDIPDAEPADEKVTEGEGLISAEKVSAFIFITGYALMALGMLAGLVLAWGDAVSILMGLYIGGSSGWLGGFLVAFVLIAGQQKSTDTVKCPACGYVTKESETCGHCGLPLTTRNLHPITAGCLAAGRFALNNKWSAMCIILPAVLAYLIYGIPQHIFDMFEDPWGARQYMLLGAGVVAVFFIFSNWVGILLVAVQASKAKNNIIKTLPWFWQADGILAGLRCLAVILIYILPLVTLPLLPLGLLAISSRNKIGLLDIKYHIRFAKAHTQEIALLWLFMLMWGSGMFLGCMIVEGISQLTHYIPYAEEEGILIARGILHVVLYAITVGLLSLAMFRCVGEFGRCCKYGEPKA